MLIKAEGWPRVQPDDNGIRPVGPSDCCFYCNQEVGQEHRRECVTIYKLVRYQVLLDGIAVGDFVRSEPFNWSLEECLSHKNESSWCKDNALEEIRWHVKSAADQVGERMVDRCACSVIAFAAPEVLDSGPLIEIRDDERRE